MPRLLLALAACAASASVVGACATRSGGFDGTPIDDGGTPVGPDASALGDVAAVDAGKGETLLYTHDNTSLYRIDPKDPKLGLQKVGDFDCIVDTANPPPLMGNAMTDIAVDRDGRLFGIASYTIFLDMQVSGTTVACKANAKQLAAEAGAIKFYGASFAPAGTLDPTGETLVVANTDGELFAVDTQTATLTLVGRFGNVPSSDGNGNNYPSGNVGKAWELSGDIVFAENGGKPIGFATLRDCPNPPSTNNCNTIDTLVELDMSRLSAQSPGVVVKSVRGQIRKAKQGCPDGTTGGYGSMFGIAAFGSDVLGFSRDGLIVRVDNNTGAACLVSDASGQFVAPNRGFNGAGVTTRVAVTTPPPR